MLDGALAQNGGGLRSSFFGNGFFILRQGVPEQKMDTLRRTMRETFQKYGRAGETIFETSARLDKEDQPLLYGIYQAVSYSTALSDLRIDCARMVNALYEGSDPLICIDSAVLFGLPQDKRLAYDWHQEAPYMPGFDQLVNFWIPVFDPSSIENGSMSVLVGSQKRGTLSYRKHRSAHNSYTDLVPTEIETLSKEHTEFLCECAPGDVVVFHKDLIHRSNHNASPRTRFSAVFRLARLNQFPKKYTFSSADY